MSFRSLLLFVVLLGGLTSCATTDEAAPKKLYNPGDELNSRAWGQGNRSSHYATPFGLPLSQ